MDAGTVAWLLGAGLTGGVITAVVGGSSLITFPAMLAVGLPPVAATASNTVSMTPSNFIAVMADYQKLPQWRPAFAWIVVISIIGSAFGAWLLFLTPERVFMAAVPVLIASATLLFAIQGPIKRWTVRHSDDVALHTVYEARGWVAFIGGRTDAATEAYDLAAHHARRAYPGAVGELLARELTAHAEFGYRFTGDGLLTRLARRTSEHLFLVFSALLGAILAGVPLRESSLTVMVLVAALPSASNVALLAERFGADTGRIARIILLTTAAAFFTFSAAVAIMH